MSVKKAVWTIIICGVISVGMIYASEMILENTFIILH